MNSLVLLVLKVPGLDLVLPPDEVLLVSRHPAVGHPDVVLPHAGRAGHHHQPQHQGAGADHDDGEVAAQLIAVIPGQAVQASVTLELLTNAEVEAGVALAAGEHAGVAAELRMLAHCPVLLVARLCKLKWNYLKGRGFIDGGRALTSALELILKQFLIIHVDILLLEVELEFGRDAGAPLLLVGLLTPDDRGEAGELEPAQVLGPGGVQVPGPVQGHHHGAAGVEVAAVLRVPDLHRGGHVTVAEQHGPVARVHPHILAQTTSENICIKMYFKLNRSSLRDPISANQQWTSPGQKISCLY